MKDLFIASLPYYSQPEFPNDCKFSFNSDIFLRDMLGCLSSKENHYEYPKFQDFSYDVGCMRRNLPRIIKEFLDGKEVYILFRTTQYDFSNKKTYISGYYKISKAFRLKTYVLGKEKPFCGVFSNENVFLNKLDANSWKGKQIRGAIYSTNEKYTEYFHQQIEYYKSFSKTSKNKKLIYHKKTIEWMEKLKQDSFRKEILDFCPNKCLYDNCFLKNKILNYQKKWGNKFHLNYLYDSKVYLTDIVEKLKRNKIEYITKSKDYVEM